MADFYYTSRARDLDPQAMNPMFLLLSAASNLRQPTTQNPARIQVPRLPTNLLGLGADPGAYPVTIKYGCEYPYTLEDYYTWLCALQPDWAATEDLCCSERKEQVLYDAHGRAHTHTTFVSPGAREVRRRQDFATDMAATMFERWLEAPWAAVPTLQGFRIEEYEHHARMLKPIIHKMWAFYQYVGCYCYYCFDDASHPLLKRWHSFRVGLGSLVGRDQPGFIREIMLRVRAILGPFIPIHGWGLKRRYLKSGQRVEGFASYDTATFDDRFNQIGRAKQKASGKPQRLYRWQDAQPDFATTIDHLMTVPPPLRLFPDPPPEPIHGVQIYHDLGCWLTKIERKHDGNNYPGQ